MKKYQSFLSENFQFFWGEIFYIFEYACFHNVPFMGLWDVHVNVATHQNG